MIWQASSANKLLTIEENFQKHVEVNGIKKTDREKETNEYIYICYQNKDTEPQYE